MKNKITVCFLFCVALLTATCKKDSGKTHVDAYLVNALNGKGIANGTVYLEKINSSACNCSMGSIIATYNTNASGHFVFDFIADADPYSYAVYGSSPYYQGNEGTSVGVLQIKKGHVNSGHVSLNPYGWVKLHVKNTLPHDSIDMITIYSNAIRYSGFFQFIGKNIDTTVIEQLGILCRPTCNDYITYTVGKNHVSTSYTITANTSPVDTVTTLINY